MSTIEYTYYNLTSPPINISDITTTQHLPSPAHEPWTITILAILAGVVSVATTGGNTMVVISFIMEKKIRQPANYLIASLAVTDILIGGSSMPLYTVYLLKGYWPLGDLTCDLWLSLDYTVCLVSQYTVFLITLDRFCSVKVAAKYRQWRTAMKMKVMIAATWLIPTAIFFSIIMIWHHLDPAARDPHYCQAMFQTNPMFSAILVICYYWVTLVVMIALYIGIYKVALGLQKKSKRNKQRVAKLIQNGKSTPTEKEKLLISSSEMTGMTPPQTTSENGGVVASARTPMKTVPSGGSSPLTPIKSQNRLCPPPRGDKYSLAPPSSQTPAMDNHAEHETKEKSSPGSTTELESPVWKPRTSLPNASIHWDQLSGETFHKIEKGHSCESSRDISGSASPSPVVAIKRQAKKKKRSSRRQNQSDYNDSSSETSDSENKPRAINQLSSLLVSITTSPKPRTQASKTSANQKKSRNRARKALRTISFILGAFVVCWTPYHLIVLIDSFCTTCDKNNKIYIRLYEFSYWLCYMNSPLNPFCYALSNPQFKQSFIKILKFEYIRNCWRKLHH